MSDEARRRLAAIVCADVAGYSRLMGADEDGTLTTLKAHRRALVDPTVAAHRGRIVKTTGDGMLLEFASAVGAVRCCVEVQQGMAERNAAIPVESHPTAPIRRALMIVLAAEIGDAALSREHLDYLNSFSPDFIPSLFKGENPVFKRPEHMKLLLDGLRKAGLTD